MYTAHCAKEKRKEREKEREREREREEIMQKKEEKEIVPEREYGKSFQIVCSIFI